MRLGQPGQLATIAKSIPGRDTVNDRLNYLEKMVDQLTVANSGNFTTINGTLVVTGTEEVTGNLMVSGTLNVTGSTEIGGTLTITGDVDSSNFVTGVSGWNLDGASGNAEFNSLTLRDGIIGDASLTNPVASAVGNKVRSAFTLTNTLTTIDTVTITVPSGFTTANVHAVTHMFALSSTAGPQVTVNTVIDGSTSIGGITRGQTGDIVETVDSFAVQLSGLSGSFTISVLGSATSCDSGGGTSIISANVIFTR